MAKRYQIINVLRKPRKCPNCGEEVWECSCCNTRFRKIKPDGTDAPVKIQLLANIKPAPATRV